MESLQNKIPYKTPNYLSNSSFYLRQQRDIGIRFNSEQTLIHNFSQGNIKPQVVCSMMDTILNFDVNDRFAATGRSEEITLWDINTGKCRWKFDLLDPEELYNHRFEIFKIVDRFLVMSTQVCGESVDKDILRIIDIDTGKEIRAFQRENLVDNIAIAGNRLFYADEKGSITKYDLDRNVIASCKKEKLKADAPRSSDGMVMDDLPIKDKPYLGSDKYFVDIENDGFFFINIQADEGGFINLKLEELGLEPDCIEYQSSHIYNQYLFIGIQAYADETAEYKNYIYVYDLDNRSYQWLPCEKSENPIQNIRFNGDKLCFNIGNNVTIIDSISSKVTTIESKYIEDLSSDEKILILSGKDSYHFYDLVGMRFIKAMPLPTDSKTLLKDGIFYTNSHDSLLKYDFNLIDNPEEMEIT